MAFSSWLFSSSFVTVLSVIHARPLLYTYGMSHAPRLLVMKLLMNLGQKLPRELKPVGAGFGFGLLHPVCLLILMETNTSTRRILAVILGVTNGFLTHRKL